jgi:hypothetical protein
MDAPAALKSMDAHAATATLEPQHFDEYDDDHIKQVAGDLAPAIGRIFLTLREIDCAERIEALNKERALKRLRADAEELLAACKEEWRNL